MKNSIGPISRIVTDVFTKFTTDEDSGHILQV